MELLYISLVFFKRVYLSISACFHVVTKYLMLFEPFFALHIQSICDFRSHVCRAKLSTFSLLDVQEQNVKFTILHPSAIKFL